MPLLEMTSNLAQINKNFGSGTSTAGNTTSFPYAELKVAPIPQTLYLDSKGDSNPIFTSINKAFPNVYNVGDALTPLQTTSVLGIDGMVNHASNPNRYGFTFAPPYSQTTKYPGDGSPTGAPSRLNFKHQVDRVPILNAGFTRPALGLDNYYAQANNDTGQLGIRNDRLDAQSQPYITRNIGQRWGINSSDVEPLLTNNFIRPLGQIAINAAKGISSGVFGRDITIYADRHANDVIRLSRFANPLSTYVIQNQILQRRNPFKKVTSEFYKDKRLGSVSLDDNALSFGDLGRLSSYNPQVYNLGSVFSAPGVPGLMFHRMGKSGLDIAGMNIEAAKNAANALYAGAQVAGILGQYSARAISIAAPVAANIVSHTVGGVGNFLVEHAKGVSNPLAGLSNPLAGISNPFAGISNPLAGISNPLAGISNPLAGLSNPLAGISNPLSGLSNPFAKASIKGLAGKLGEIDLSPAGRAIARAAGATVSAAEAARDKAAQLLGGIGPLGKGSLMNLDAEAFGDIKVDRINLIPFGKIDYEETSYDNLDWIPFKFKDLKTGSDIVFRATLKGITDTFTPEYSSERYVGRPDKVHVYQGTDREISFTFDVYPSSATELFIIWEKLNYLAGQTYPHWSEPGTGGGKGMISPFTGLTIGQMYNDTPGIISSLTYTIPDEGNWEVEIAKLPKYVSVSVGFTHVGRRLPSAMQKHYDLPRIPEEIHETKTLKSNLMGFAQEALSGGGAKSAIANVGGLGKSEAKSVLGKVGL